MIFFYDSLRSAAGLILHLDPELFRIVLFSLSVSLSSTLIASLAGIPAGFLIGVTRFRGRRILLTLLNSLLALPTVVIGLGAYTFLSRRGLLGAWGLLYSREAIIIGQVILITPLVTALMISAVSRIDSRYRDTARTLGAGPWMTAWTMLQEARYAVVSVVVTAFGRVISEIGISMMLGGNARGFTRTMTTAMALEYDKGEFVLALSLGLILMGVSLGVNAVFHFLQGETAGGDGTDGPKKEGVREPL
ncbi:MAG: ABC transporter permease [Desulfobacterales bacterium]|nr:MAG: ABC transporter permease [Desulfobacterales bacterium]